LLEDATLTGRELLAEVGETTMEWVLEGLRRGKHGKADIPTRLAAGEWQFGDQAFVAIRGCASGEEEHWLVTFQHEHFNRSFAPPLWRTDVRLTSIGDQVEFDLSVRATSLVADAPARFRPVRPRLVLTLVTCHDASIAGARVFAEPLRAADEDVERLVPDVLLSSKRRLPADAAPLLILRRFARDRTFRRATAPNGALIAGQRLGVSRSVAGKASHRAGDALARSQVRIDFRRGGLFLAH
jgi:hypothetical protein